MNFLMFKLVLEKAEKPEIKWSTFTGSSKKQESSRKTSDWFQRGKGVRKGCILSPCLFNLYAEYIMRNAGLNEHKLES